MGLLTWMESTAYSDWILVSSTGWPIMLSAHAIGLAIAVGIVFSADVRLLGLYGQIPYSSLHKLMSIAWIGVAINVFTGVSLFMTQASSYIVSIPFLTKIALIALGCANLYYTQKILRRDSESWDASGTVPRIGVMLAASSIAFWTLAVITGRLIAYL